MSRAKRGIPSTMARDTGFPAADAQSDFLRARRDRNLAAVARRLRREPGDVNVILPFEEVVQALGRTGQRSLGLKVVPLEDIVGTVDRTRDFDRSFRPTTGRVRSRWERIAQAMRRGETIPPISLYKVGNLYFVRDGHHRVSVARALGRKDIDAYVTEVSTKVGPEGSIRPSDLPLKSHERLFRERVPLPGEKARRLHLSDPWQYGALAEGVEAWGFRAMQDRRDFLDRPAVATLWFDEEYAPVVTMLREADMIGDGTETDAYVRVAALRYRLLRTHEWTPEILAQLRTK
jgi:hypothetical protein